MKIPKILILVLAGNTKVSNRNLKTQQNTWMKHSYPQIEIISYKGGAKNQFINSELILNCPDDYESISLKTLMAFDWVNDNCKFDYIFRTNTSSYVNVKRLLDFCSKNDNNYLYRGRIISDVFNNREVSWASGAEILMSKSSFDVLIDNKHFWNTALPDDVAIGSIFQEQKIEIESSNSTLFDRKFFDRKNLDYEYHFRCRVDSPYYYPRFLDPILLRYIHKELNNINIPITRRYVYKIIFFFSQFLAIKKHKDYFFFYLWNSLKYIKKIIRK